MGDAKGDDIQTDICAMLVCRVLVGRCHIVQQPGDHTPVMIAGEAETVIGDREAAVCTYREFVVGSGARIYPEFAVIYQRVFSKDHDGTSAAALADVPLEPL